MTDDSLGVLLLPSRLEQFELAPHARDLLAIPRVLAVEPGRVPVPSLMRDAVARRHARRLKFPGRPRLIVLYHPAQYPLARALLAGHDELELWYVAPDPAAGPAMEPADTPGDRERRAWDELVREHAATTLTVADSGSVQDAALRARLRELEIINPYAFAPGARLQRR